eukprot:UN09225
MQNVMTRKTLVSIHTIHYDSQDSSFRFMRFIMSRKTLFRFMRLSCLERLSFDSR